jgi:predicted negative regulator of RcsB-dependent stress response
MQKVYLLLRDNQQTGPYSFEELLRLQLKQNDLIWIEGKSYGWRYPAEVESLKPYLPTANSQKKETKQSTTKNTEPTSSGTTSPKKIFISMPANSQVNGKENSASIDPIEQKAEELRKRAQAYIPQHEEVRTNYGRNIKDAEEEYTHWAYERKIKKKSKLPGKTLVIGCIVVLIVLAGWWMKGEFSDTSSAVTTIAVQDKELSQKQEITTPVEPIKEEQSPSTEELKPRAEKSRKEKAKEPITDKAIIQNKSTATETISTIEEPIIDQTPVSGNKEDNTETSVQAPVENKKTLKEKIGDLFKKKKETEEAPQTAENANSERKATRREDENATISVTDISDQVEVKTNKIADSWMMGVKNVKLTLYNRSDLTLNVAKAEVLYYSDQNTLLEKRIISFANIPPKKSQTLSIPDNRLADHIDYKVVLATGVENAYANR